MLYVIIIYYNRIFWFLYVAIFLMGLAGAVATVPVYSELIKISTGYVYIAMHINMAGYTYKYSQFSQLKNLLNVAIKS